MQNREWEKFGVAKKTKEGGRERHSYKNGEKIPSGGLYSLWWGENTVGDREELTNEGKKNQGLVKEKG